MIPKRAGLVVATLVAGLMASCSGGSTGSTGATAASTSEPPTSTTTATGLDGWLCHPDLDDDPCTVADLRTTNIDWQLTQTVDDGAPAINAAADCLYVPPQSTDATTALEWARIEIARFRTVCRVFVPDAEGDAEHLDEQFSHFLAESSNRPFLLVGHGQGADLLTDLVQARIDPDPGLRARLLSAMLLGGEVIQVPEGQAVGGTFTNLPLCGSSDQIGCIISFHGYEAGTTPSDATPDYAGIAPGQVAACTSPAGLDGSKGQLRAATFPVSSSLAPTPTISGLPAVETPFVTLPEYYVAQCLDLGGGRPHLWVDRTIDPDDARSPAPLSDPGSAALGLGTPEHELALTMGDLLFLAARQIDSSGVGG